MRNSLIFGLLALAIIFLAGPYFTGGRVAQWHAQQLGSLQAPLELAGLPKGWRVEQSQLSRGWFTSDLNLRLLPPENLCDQDPCAALPFNARMHHGPLALGALPARAAMLPSLAVVVTPVDLNQFLSGQPPNPPLPQARVATRITLTGDSRSRFDLPASSHQFADGAAWSHDGLSGHWSDTHQSVSLQTANATYTTAQGTSLTLKNSELQRGAQEYTLALGELQLSRSGQPGLELAGLDVEISTHRTPPAADMPALTSARVEATMQTLRQGQRGIGPMSLAVNLDRMAMDSLQKVRSSLTTIYGRDLPPHLQQLALQGLLLRELPALTRSGPRIELENFVLNLGEEPIKANMDLRLAPDSNARNDLAGFLGNLDLTAEIQLPATVAELFATRSAAKSGLTPGKQLEQWRNNGWLIAKEDRYHSHLQLTDGHLTINGNESPQWAAWMERIRVQQAQNEGLAGQRNWRKRLLTPPGENGSEDTP